MSEFSIEVRGTHVETDHRPWDVIIDRLLKALPPAGFRIEFTETQFHTVESQVAEIEEKEAPDSEPAAFLGFMLFDPRALTAAEVKLRVAEIDELSVLHAGAALERLHPKRKGGRVVVLGHIESRIQKIIG